MQHKERQKNRPLATQIAELRQAVLAEGTRFRARGLAAQPGVSASRALPLAKPAFASAAASSAEQPASINVVPTSGEETSAAQPGSKTKQRRATALSKLQRGVDLRIDSAEQGAWNVLKV